MVQFAGEGLQGAAQAEGQEPQLQLSRRRAPGALEQRQGQEPTAAEDQSPSALDPVSQATTGAAPAEPGASQISDREGLRQGH